MHLLAAKRDRILLDCGLYQGRRKESKTKNRTFAVDPASITNVVLSHAHIDHSGRIPLLASDKFNGRIICTRATRDACEYLLLDSAHIQESDALYLNYKSLRSFLHQVKNGGTKKKLTNRRVREIKKLLKKGKHELKRETIREMMKKNNLREVEPLYTIRDAENALGCFDGFPYNETVTIGRSAEATFYDAGHILGSAFSVITVKEKDQVRKILYTGDMGRFKKPIIHDPTLEFAEKDRDIDLLVMESTYGNRFHDPVKDLKGGLQKVLCETRERGGSVIIPSFAFGRTQELLLLLHELYLEKAVKRVPVYVDSPLASRLTKVFGEHPEIYDEETHKVFLEQGKNPFFFDQIRFVGSVEESMALMKMKKPHIVISASGMCEAGRVLHHLRYKVHNPNNTILIVGFMAQHTLGRRMQEMGLAYEKGGRKGEPPMIRFLNKEYPLAARVKELGGFSAHADRDELYRLVSESNLRIKKIALVHGEESQSLAFADFLKKKACPVVVPKPGETLAV